MKIDDDNYVNVPNLVKLLHNKKVIRDFILGDKLTGKEPVRKPKSKW